MNLKRFVLLILSVIAFVAVQCVHARSVVLMKETNTIFQTPKARVFRVIANNVHSYYNRLIDWELFDAIQINIDYVEKVMPNGDVLHIPVDRNKNHYFIG
jgi:hypothetical protein